MARTPRKKAAGAVETRKAGTVVFSEPMPFDELPPKQVLDENYRQLERLVPGTMIAVEGGDLKVLKGAARKVVKNNAGRVYDFRFIDPADQAAGVNVYRLADKE